MTKANARVAVAATIALAVALVLTAGLSRASNSVPPESTLSPRSDLPAPARATGEGQGSVRMPRPGISGTIEAPPRATDLDGDGTAEVAFGTTNGFYIVGKQGIELHIGPLAPVSEFTPITDINNDATDDVVIAVSDTQFPNIRAYDTVTGEEIWSYRPAQTTFVNNLMWTSQQTLTFDLSSDDLDNDGTQEVLATSGYRLYALSATTGALQWHYEWRDNLWRAASVDDFTGDGIRDVVVGSQDGYIIGVDGETGGEAWKKQVAGQYEARGEGGSPGGKIPQGVWDILPSSNGGSVVVTSEDGIIRSISVPGGDVEWEAELVPRIDAALARFYSRKNGQPTGPADIHFFNLRAQFVPDVTGDGRDDLLATSYLGAERLEDPRRAALYLMNGSTGQQLWKKQVASVATARRLAIAEIAGEHFVVVPGGDTVTFALADGKPAGASVTDTLGLSADIGQDTGYSLIALEPEGAVVMSDNGDILWNENGSSSQINRTARNRLIQTDLVGDPVPDVLVVASSSVGSNFGIEPRAQLLYVLDGATGLLSWEYEPPAKLTDATGGLAGVTIGPDLDGDGRPEILAYAQDPSELQGRESDTPGEDSRVVVLNGSDGSEILVAGLTENTYYGIWEDLYLGGGSLEELVRSEMVNSRIGELEHNWNENDMPERINQFLSESDNRWNDFVERSVNEQAAEFGRTGIGGSGGDEQQARMEADWEEMEFERTAVFDNSLSEDAQILESLGVDAPTIATYQDRRREIFNRNLEGEREQTFENWRNEAGFSPELQEQALEEFRNELIGQRDSIEKEWMDEYLASLDSEKEQWMNENLGNIDNEIAEQLEQLTREFEDGKNWRRIDKRISSVSPIRFPGTTGDYGLLVATGRDISVLDLSGNLIWGKTADPNVYSTPFSQTDVDVYALGFNFDSNRPVRVIGDINGDGVDDLRFMDGRAMFIATSTVSNGRVNYRPGDRITGSGGEEGEGDVSEVDDVNGDGIKDVAFFQWIENAPPNVRILSGTDGSKLLDLDGLDPNSASFKPSSDFNGDGDPDMVLFERWVEGAEGPRISILDGRSGDAIWVYSELNEGQMLDGLQIDSEIMPVTPVGDLTGDGIDEVALVRHLTYQPGAFLLVIDITSGDTVKEIVMEQQDSERGQDERWHPGLLVTAVGDLNGDGSGEIAVVNAFGEEPERKEYRLAVIDLDSETVLADFRTIGSQLITLEEAGLFGLVGLDGEVYTLDPASELAMTGPPQIVNTPGKVTVSWTGTPEGSFNQVFVDNLEVARTNGSN
ncbi:MAG: PQQ-binding-like beta-propeller repeat protein, partial [Dehalococcoidia bacterium]|nr:PQQ-binding-like beta-propeller repeat protein [Dehalococcoidia bacterium]